MSVSDIDRYLLNDVVVLRPTLANEARLGLLRSVGVAMPAQPLNPTDLGIRVGTDDAVGLPQLGIGGGLNFGGPANTFTRRQGTTFVVSDTLSYQGKNHSLRMGGDYRRYNSQGYTRDSGRLNFRRWPISSQGLPRLHHHHRRPTRGHFSKYGRPVHCQTSYGFRQNRR